MVGPVRHDSKLRIRLIIGLLLACPDPVQNQIPDQTYKLEVFQCFMFRIMNRPKSCMISLATIPKTFRTLLTSWRQTIVCTSMYLCYPQRCGTVTIFTAPVPTFEKLWFRFRLFESYGSGSYFWKVVVPVPAPYLDHKKLIFQKNVGIFLPFYIVSCFTRKKFINFNKFIGKCEWTKCEMKVIKYIILYLNPVPEP
jgi:hypothetical protein